MKTYRFVKRATVNKYGNIHTVAADGVKCPSRKHAGYRNKLILAKNSGQLLLFLEEVKFRLVGGIVHRLDFVEFWADGVVRFTEVKGRDLKLGELKRLQTERDYNITIEVV